MLRGFTICVAKDRHFIFYLREEAQYIMKNNHSYASIRNLLPKTFAVVKSISTFAVRQLYLHNSYVDTAYFLIIYWRSYTRVFIRRIAVKRLSQT